MNSLKPNAFTLIELVIVIGILAVLAAVVVIVINPAQKMAEARDASRMSDFNQIASSIGLYLADGKSGIGSTNIIYVSIPDSSATCANLGLPSLPGGWSYQCSTSANYRKTDGNGWIPINFTQVSFGNVVQTLPVDPVNATSTGNYYTYVTGGSYQLSAIFESNKYNSSLKTQYYAIGTNTNLMPTLALVASSTGVKMNLSTANGYAFITSSSLDLSPYLNKYVTISDGTKSISGFIKAQGSGETLSGNFSTNGTFDTDTAWTKGTGVTISGGALNSDGSAGSGTNLGFNENLSAGATYKKLYKVVFDIAAYTAGTVRSGVGGYTLGTSKNSVGTFIDYINPNNSGSNSRVYITNGVGFNGSVDNVYWYQILTPSTSGVTITNTRGGTTYNWLSNTGINPNAASFTVTISP